MDYDMPKFMLDSPVPVECEGLGTVVVLGSTEVTFNGAVYTLADVPLFNDEDDNFVDYTGQEANAIYLGQWWENGERVLFHFAMFV